MFWPIVLVLVSVYENNLAGNPFIHCWNFCVFMKSAGHGCLATADAMGVQATERFGKEEKAAYLAF